ncbi:Ionotropic receptor 234 [Frankliniella occidentalis]|nr:Ionotropic receptor 234 [Frankliniella occidentalis]
MALLLAVGALAVVAHAALLDHALERLDAVHRVPTEAACTASLLARLVAPHNGNLFVYHTRQMWLNNLLRQLSFQIPRVLMDSNFDWERNKRVSQLNKFVDVDLIVRDEPNALLRTLASGRQSHAFLDRTLLVTGAASNHTVKELLRSRWPVAVLALSLVVAYPDGAADLLRITSVTCTCTAYIEQKDRWSPGLGWKENAAPFVIWCDRWVMPGGGGTGSPRPRILMETEGVNPTRVKGALEVARQAGMEVATVNRSVFPIKPEDDKRICQMDVVFFGIPFLVGRPSEIDGFFVTSLSQEVLALPKGLGTNHFMRALVVEFPPVMWGLTLLGALGVAAALACSPAAAPTLLRAVAPLLGQPLPGRDTRHPLLAVWLLATVIIVAAYQSQLLKMMRRPHRSDINSVEEVWESGLPVTSGLGMYHLTCIKYPGTTGSGCIPTRKLIPTIIEMALYGNFGIFFYLEHVPRWLVELGRVHLVTGEFSHQTVRAHFFMPRASPLAERFRVLLARIDGAGLEKHWDIWQERVFNLVRMSIVDTTVPIRLRVPHILPALVVLGCGLCLCAAVLTAEFVVHRFRDLSPGRAVD